MRTLKDFNFRGKKVLVRCDFNVPLSGKGEVLDDFRIKRALPTIKYLRGKGAKIILMSHLGRPSKNQKSKTKFPFMEARGKKRTKFSSLIKNQKFSLRLIALRLEELLRNKVKFLDDCIREKVEKEIAEMKKGEIVLLENLRFYKEEEENNLEFAKKLASLGDIYINEAFSVCHRKHASVVRIPKYLISGAGFLLKKEIEVLRKLMKSPQKPLVVIIGGVKVETKVGVIDKISPKADFILIGGIIKKEIEEKKIKLKNPQKIIKPVDSVGTFDIGKKTIILFKEKIKKAKTIFWSGPLGKIEEKEFQKGSKEIAKTIIDSGSFSVAGGGETVEFINQMGLLSKFKHISTGGGAMLEFLAGEKLPGIEALKHGRDKKFKKSN